MSEETDALNNRIRQLESQVADMQRLVQDTSDLLDIARANGLDKFLTGHGFWESQGGVVRFDTHGMQLATGGTFTPAIWGVNQLVAVPSGESTYIKLQLSADPSGASFDFLNQTTGNITSEVKASTSNVTGVAQAKHEVYGTYQLGILHNGTTTAYGWCDLPFWFVAQGGDPSTTLSDGMVWWNDVALKLRARINGATENLATESYVAANAPTGFADHFLVMGG